MKHTPQNAPSSALSLYNAQQVNVLRTSLKVTKLAGSEVLLGILDRPSCFLLDSRTTITAASIVGLQLIVGHG